MTIRLSVEPPICLGAQLRDKIVDGFPGLRRIRRIATSKILESLLQSTAQHLLTTRWLGQLGALLRRERRPRCAKALLRSGEFFRAIGGIDAPFRPLGEWFLPITEQTRGVGIGRRRIPAARAYAPSASPV